MSFVNVHRILNCALYHKKSSFPCTQRLKTSLTKACIWYKSFTVWEILWHTNYLLCINSKALWKNGVQSRIQTEFKFDSCISQPLDLWNSHFPVGGTFLWAAPHDTSSKSLIKASKSLNQICWKTVSWTLWNVFCVTGWFSPHLLTKIKDVGAHTRSWINEREIEGREAGNRKQFGAPRGIQSHSLLLHKQWPWRYNYLDQLTLGHLKLFY